MNEWLARASRWQLGVIMGLSCGLIAGLLVGVVFGDGWSGALPAGIGTAVGGLILGTTIVHGQLQRQAEAVGVLSGPVRRSAGRASLWGPVPEDPATRAAAYALTQHALAEQRRGRVFGVVNTLVVVAVLVVLAIQASPWWWIAVALGVGLPVFGGFVLPRRLRRRAELLRP